jgi:hypothetical protein
VSSFFLCKKFGIKVDEAVARFSAARGYTFDDAQLIRDLKDKFKEI